MIVYNENQKEAFEIFKNTCDISQYVSFDCEMTGINLGTKTDGTQYDTQEFRYYKQRQVVSKFDLIQIGLTFYQEKIKKIEKEPEKANEKKEKEFEEKKYYLERTFLFYLYKNSKLKMINDDLFDSELKAHPAALKFLGDSNFDFNILIKKGINFNKLQNKEKIKEALNEKNANQNQINLLTKENDSFKNNLTINEEQMRTKINELELSLNEKIIQYEKDQILWDGKIKFVEQQRDILKKENQEATKRFENMLDTIKKKNNAEKENIINDKNITIKIIK